LFFLDILSGKVWFVLVSLFIYSFGHPVSFWGLSCDFRIFHISGSLPLPTRQSPLQKASSSLIRTLNLHARRVIHRQLHRTRLTWLLGYAKSALFSFYLVTLCVLTPFRLKTTSYRPLQHARFALFHFQTIHYMCFASNRFASTILLTHVSL